MRTFDGLHLDVTTYGPDNAPVTVLLAHCWTLNQEDWHYVVRDLLGEFGHDVRIITWDHRGHGRSDHAPRQACTVANLARDLGDLIDTHAPRGPLVLAGHSIGGMTMMALAEQRPDILERVTGAVFVSTSSSDMDTVTLGLPDTGPAIRAQIPRVLALRSKTLTKRARRRAPIIERQVVRRFVMGRPHRLADAGLTIDGIISSPAATVVGFYEDMLTHHRTGALKAFAGIPTAVLVGTRDVLTPPAHARRIAAAIPGSVLIAAPDAGHMLPLERHELVTGELSKLIRRNR